MKPTDPARLAAFLTLARTGYSLSEIARRHGISRERVRQVLLKAGYTLKDLAPPHTLRLTYAAHRALRTANRWTVCANCGATIKRPPRTDGSPSFCNLPSCHAAWMSWTYHNNPTSKTTQYLHRRRKGDPTRPAPGRPSAAQPKETPGHAAPPNAAPKAPPTRY
jgi:transposase-like protein